MLALLSLPTVGGAQCDIGVVILPPAGVFTVELSALSDAFVNAVAELPGYEAVLLDGNSAFVQSCSAEDQLIELSPASSDERLRSLASLLDLDELLVIQVSVSETGDTGERVRVATRWANADHDPATQFDIELSGLTSVHIQAASEKWSEYLRDRHSAATPPLTRPEAMPASPMIPTVAQDSVATEEAKQSPGGVVASPDVSETSATNSLSASPEEMDGSGAQRLAAARTALAVGDLELARKEADLALREGVPVYQTHMFRADLAVAQNQPEDQRRALERAVAANPQAVEPLLRLGAVFDAQGLWQKAVECYDQALDLDPSCLSAYTGAANVLSAHGRPKQAATYLAQAVTNSPQDTGLLIRLGDTYRQANMLAEAEEAYEQAAQTAEPQVAAQVLDRLGDMYVSSDQYEEGFYCYAQAGRLRGASRQPLTQKRYEQIMLVADEAVVTALRATSDAFDTYQRERAIPREKAYVIAERAEVQVADVTAFISELAPPDTLKTDHLRRHLFYNLAAEAIVALMTYLDTNLEQALGQYERAAREAQSEYDQLRSAPAK
jgi:tetratricopeptide (TPR) repeat protein